MVNIIIFPFKHFFSIFHKFLLDVISIPLVGSSKKITELPPTNAIDIDNFLFCPPDKSLALVYLFSSNPTSSIAFVISNSILDLSIDLIIQNISKCSSTVNSSINISCWEHIPKSFLNFSIPSGDNILYEL